MQIIAVDPGNVTGLAWVKLAKGNHQYFDAIELPMIVAAKMLEDRLAGNGERKIVAVEQYTVNNNTVKHSRQYDALEMIGIARYLCNKYGAEFRMQAPAARNLCQDGGLKKMNWYRASPDKHMVDAAKHLAVACLHYDVLKVGDLRV